MKGWISMGLLLALLAGAGVSHIHLHNRLVALDVAAEAQWKQVENQLQRQHELLPKLATLTKRYVEHEKAVLDSLFASRERYASVPTEERPTIAAEVDGVLVQALALAERYPELKADQQYRGLALEIAGTKNRIAVERKRYNDVVAHLNTRLRQLPWRLAAGELAPRAFYEVPEEKLAEPELEL